MDVVRENISELGGQVRIESQPGHGTRVVLSLPLTLVTTRVLLVRVGRTMLALPATGCRGTIWIRQERLQNLEGRPTIEIEGRTVGVHALADVLSLSADPGLASAARRPAVLVGNPQRMLAFSVDALLDEREAVVKPLGPLFAARRVYSGAVQLGDGSLVLLLNPTALTQEGARRAPATVQRGMPRRRRLLVVDDSFTTRELIRSILASAGYDVQAAVDGADALDKLRSHPYDLVVSDVEMPRIDGLTLTLEIRSDPQLDTLPVVLITSLASEAHRRRGLEAGAQAYIVKSQFNQDGLLEVIQQLLGHEG
jgi:two-component system chemotaxis sensor kinase CheA